MKTLLKTTAMALALLGSSNVMAKAEKYNIDPTHSFVQFKASHLGFSWLMGRFNEVEGVLNYDKDDVTKSSISVKVNTQSLDSNHAKRDKHLKSDDYIDASKHPQATFKSTKITKKGEKLLITGDFSFRGITRDLTIKAKLVGAGKSPWGDERIGYEGIAKIDQTHFGMKGKPGNEKSMVELRLFIEAIK